MLGLHHAAIGLGANRSDAGKVGLHAVRPSGDFLGPWEQGGVPIGS